MEKCLICGKEFKNKQILGLHVKNEHKISAKDYKIKFNLLPTCKTCNVILPKWNKTGYCNLHRNCSGENNPFFGKHHSEETKENFRKSSSIGVKKNGKMKNIEKK